MLQKMAKEKEPTIKEVNGGAIYYPQDSSLNPIDFISKLVDRDKDQGSFILPRYPFVIAGVSDDSPNKSSELQSKDIVTAIGGENIKYFEELSNSLEKIWNILRTCRRIFLRKCSMTC